MALAFVELYGGKKMLRAGDAIRNDVNRDTESKSGVGGGGGIIIL